ncbi:MAG TPA: valine--tRNA ligase [Candidatus Saccharimonadales bacterium]|nr:valine--tRNA ligase [Candidatus Saccharimonadales bacterium]
MTEIPTRFDHTKEAEIYQKWEKAGEFKPKGSGEPFSIIIPPPNVTGDLHLGHALTYGLQDTVARHARRHGKKVLMVPGADHAAIAVQALVEKKIQKEKGLSRTQLGREKFLEEVQDWTAHYLPRVKESLKRFGLSADWGHFRFTMDEHSQLAVKTAFVELYEKKLIYRGEYLVNWDPKLQTAISDDEVLNEDRPAKLYWLKYGPLTVATSRPETQFGDVAIAVNPKDKRYEKYVGQEVEIVLATGQKKKLPVIADEFVDPEFGTGAVKITPAHDKNDFEAGQRHNLPVVQTIDKYGKLTDLAGEWAGLKALEAREPIVKKLEELGLVEKVTDYNARVAISERSGAIIEPLISTQWFMKTTELKDAALKAVKLGDIKFTPKNVEKVYFHWLNNLHDWCISRQLWWGHELPVWHCQNWSAKTKSQKSNPKNNEGFIVALEKPKVCPICGECAMEQDPDTLDTWFSAGLWPLATLGWPDKTAPDLKEYYPTSFLETGQDILFFWVARMIMMSQALTGEIPFKEVLFHGLILDDQGKKMSKSKGNTMDPLALIDKYGSDALRMSLIGGNSPGLPQRYTETKLLKYRNFVTKIWNAARFVASTGNSKSQIPNPKQLDETEKKFLEKLSRLEESNHKDFKTYKLGLALEELYEFFWHDFADQLLEYEKKVLLESADETRKAQAEAVLQDSLKRLLVLLSDFAPFLVTEINQTMFDA